MALGTLRSYLIDAEQRFDEAAKSERWFLTFAVPEADWPANWSIVPDRGDAPPAGPNDFPAKLNIDGVCLKRKVSFTERPEWVILRLTYGFDIAIIPENKALVTGRTILIREPLAAAFTAGGALIPVVDVFPAADGDPLLFEWDITPGFERTVEVPYQMFRLSAILNAQGLIDFVGPIIAFSGGLNSATWTLLGQTIAIRQAMYRGCEWSLYRNTPGAVRLYRADFDFLVHPFVWRRIVRRTKYVRQVLSVDLVDSSGDKIGTKNIGVRSVVAGGNDTTDYFYRKTFDFTALLNGIITT